MRCGACNFNNRRGAVECAECGSVLAAKDREVRAAYQQSADKRQHDEGLFVAQYEQRRYRLMPHEPDETDEQFCARINHNKTPYVLVEHLNMEERSGRPGITREPGQEG